MSFKINKVEKLPDSEAAITGEISLDYLKESRVEALKHLNNNFSRPGFRKGQIPEEVLVKEFGEMGILAETAEIALGKSYGKIIDEAKLRPISRPEISVTKLTPGVPLEFKITLALEPEFKLPDYKKIAKEIPEADKEKKESVDERRVKIVDALMKATELALPKRFVEGELAHILAHFKEDLSRAGLSWEEYLKKAEKTEDDIKNTWREHVINRAKPEFILSKIAEAEGVKTYGEVFDILDK